MTRSIALLIVAIMMSCALSPAYSAVVHKWVDASGITHYSDEAPTSSTTPVTLIDLPAPNPVTDAAQNDYYSIANQWQRLHLESVKREKIKLEIARQQAAQQSASIQVVPAYEPQQKRYVAAYPRIFYRRHGHGRTYKKIKHYYGAMSHRRLYTIRPHKIHRNDSARGRINISNNNQRPGFK